VVHAEGGDHAAIYFFLRPVFQGPAREEFNSSLEDPYYEPSDCLLIRRGPRITSHARVVHRTMQFGPLQIPIAGLQWLATAPECQRHGQGRHLLKAAEHHMAQTGALVGWLRTSIPRFFRESGWALCGRHCYSRASARAVLARLLDHGLRQRRRPRFQIRPWRFWERDALVRIYNQNLPGKVGSLQRTEAYWDWLIRRQAYDQLYVALEGPELLELGEINTRIVGYAATKGEAILELATAPDRRKAAMELLGRACGDAIEHNRFGLSLHAPPTSDMHSLFRHAGGDYFHQESFQGEVFMARLLDPLKLLRSMRGEFRRRAERTDLALPAELGLAVEGKKYHLAVGPSAVKVASSRLGRSYLQLNVADFTRLVLGQLNWDEASCDGRLAASTQLADKVGRALFPALPLWRPPLDDLQVS
jgi:GNAT superfamily N-acetyltransferase